MKVTYIGHSGFLVEFEQAYFLFDYYEGKIPKLNAEKSLFIFVSHKHQDHYNREIWKLRKEYDKVHYILSKDVPFSLRQRGLLGLSEEDCMHVTRLSAQKSCQLFDDEKNPIQIETLKSTDVGVAYLIFYQGTILYHAGDLNRWVWRGESDDWNKEMAKSYSKQIDSLQERLHGKTITVAFLPLDPRQEEESFGGINEFLEKISVQTVFPMHLWGKYEWIAKYKGTLKEDMAKKIQDL